MGTKFLRKGKDVKLFGVCSGIADYLGVDPIAIRIVAIVTSLFTGIGVLAYIVGAIMIPKE